MFRFTIRDVLWLMVVVGLGCALWVEHKARQSEKAEKDFQIRWNKIVQRSLEREGFMLGDGDLGYVDVIPLRHAPSTDNRP